MNDFELKCMLRELSDLQIIDIVFFGVDGFDRNVFGVFHKHNGFPLNFTYYYDPDKKNTFAKHAKKIRKEAHSSILKYKQLLMEEHISCRKIAFSIHREIFNIHTLRNNLQSDPYLYSNLFSEINGQVEELLRNSFDIADIFYILLAFHYSFEEVFEENKFNYVFDNHTLNKNNSFKSFFA